MYILGYTTNTTTTTHLDLNPTENFTPYHYCPANILYWTRLRNPTYTNQKHFCFYFKIVQFFGRSTYDIRTSTASLPTYTELLPDSDIR